MKKLRLTMLNDMEEQATCPLSDTQHTERGQDVARPSEKQIIIIDDSLTVRKIAEVCLRRAGFSITPFPNGIEALHALTTEQ